MKASKFALLLAAVCLAAPAFGQIMPPNAKVGGQTLSQWLTAYDVWLNTGDGSQVYAPGNGQVVFMPIPNGEGSYTIKSNQSFVLPLFMWTIESYNNGQPDDPFWGMDVWRNDVCICNPLDPTDVPVVTLDGKRVLTNYWDYWCNGTYFSEPIPYVPPHSSGADAAIGVEGVGFVCGPLKPGVHVLTLSEALLNWGAAWENTWIITVTK